MMFHCEASKTLQWAGDKVFGAKQRKHRETPGCISKTPCLYLCSPAVLRALTCIKYSAYFKSPVKEAQNDRGDTCCRMDLRLISSNGLVKLGSVAVLLELENVVILK